MQLVKGKTQKVNAEKVFLSCREGLACAKPCAPNVSSEDREMNQKDYNIIEGFNLIAPAYDIANDAMTFGMHRLWRKELCKKASKVTPAQGSILDIATGTADVLIQLAQMRSDVQLVGIDPASAMLSIAENKINERIPLLKNNISLKCMDAKHLSSIPAKSVDTVTVSWGVRNIKPLEDGLKEIFRVLKPGGWLVILESGKPEYPLVSRLYNLYGKFLPLIGGKLSGFKPAYKYYVESSTSFPGGKSFMADLYEAGFLKGSYKRFAASLIYLYSVQKPKDS